MLLHVDRRLRRWPSAAALATVMVCLSGLTTGEAMGTARLSTTHSTTVSGAVEPAGTASQRNGARANAAEPVNISCTWTYGLFSATYQTGAGDYNITWGGRETCTPAIEMYGEARLSYEDGTSWADTGPFAGFGTIERVLPSEHVPPGSWGTEFVTEDTAPPDTVWVAPDPAGCTGAGTPVRTCVHATVQQLIPPG